MKIDQISLTIKYPKVDDLLKKYFDNRSSFEKSFFPAITTPVPEGELLEIPRIILKSKQGHSEIQISQISLSFNVVKFDNGYEENWQLCKKYIDEKIEIIKEFLFKLLENKAYDFTGLIVSVSEEKDKDASSLLSNNLLKNKNDNLHDVNVRYTFVKNKKFYVNFSVQNVRIFNSSANINVAGGLSDDKLDKNIIGIMVDVNDRYAFNNNENYKSNIDVVNELIDIMSDIINNEINNIIDRGEYKDA